MAGAFDPRAAFSAFDDAYAIAQRDEVHFNTDDAAGSILRAVGDSLDHRGATLKAAVGPGGAMTTWEDYGREAREAHSLKILHPAASGAFSYTRDELDTLVSDIRRFGRAYGKRVDADAACGGSHTAAVVSDDDVETKLAPRLLHPRAVMTTSKTLAMHRGAYPV